MMTQQSQNQRILELAREKFFTHGFSKVTMDEIATELGISKKTLYKHFSRKEQLLDEIMDLTLAKIRSGAEEIVCDQRLHFVEKLESFVAFISSNLARLKQPFLSDLQKNAPQVWQRVRAFRKEMIHTRFANLVAEGMQAGTFRTDVNSKLVVLVIFSALDTIINPETLSHLPVTAKEAFDSIIKILFEGLLAEGAKRI